MKNVLVHAHIFKNAGTTFDFSLNKHFGDSFVDHRDDDAFLQGKNKYLLEYLGDNPDVQALSSHSLHFRITSDEKIRTFPVYFLRHPLARVWSVYNFERRQADANTQGARRAKELDLNSYVDWYMEENSPATIRNIHTIFLSGDGPSPHGMEEKFSLACNTLANAETSIAVVERYDESMLMLEHSLGEFFPDLDLSYMKKNVSPESQSLGPTESANALLDKLDENVAKKLLESNALDIELYEKANRKLNNCLENIPELEKSKRDLINRCRQLQG
ncbi:MAG: hypothetical protein ACI934_000801 [Pseudohongiellaceae bacterium]|jgi:hypothetical protein